MEIYLFQPHILGLLVLNTDQLYSRMTSLDFHVRSKWGQTCRAGVEWISAHSILLQCGV